MKLQESWKVLSTKTNDYRKFCLCARPIFVFAKVQETKEIHFVLGHCETFSETKVDPIFE